MEDDTKNSNTLSKIILQSLNKNRIVKDPPTSEARWLWHGHVIRIIAVKFDWQMKYSEFAFHVKIYHANSM